MYYGEFKNREHRDTAVANLAIIIEIQRGYVVHHQIVFNFEPNQHKCLFTRLLWFADASFEMKDSN